MNDALYLEKLVEKSITMSALEIREDKGSLNSVYSLIMDSDDDSDLLYFDLYSISHDIFDDMGEVKEKLIKKRNAYEFMYKLMEADFNLKENTKSIEEWLIDYNVISVATCYMFDVEENDRENALSIFRKLNETDEDYMEKELSDLQKNDYGYECSVDAVQEIFVLVDLMEKTKNELNFNKYI